MLTVVRGKHGASRHVPLHPSTVAMLRRYAARRDRLCPAPPTDIPSSSAAHSALIAALLKQAYTRLLVQAQITTPPGQRRPSIHDLRHSFTVATLLGLVPRRPRCPGPAPDAVGHARARGPGRDVLVGYFAAPDLLALAAQRLHHHLGDLP